MDNANNHPVITAIGEDTISKVLNAGRELCVQVYDLCDEEWFEGHYLPTGDNSTSYFLSVFEAYEGAYEVSLHYSEITYERTTRITFTTLRVGLDGLRSAVESLIAA